MNEKKRILVTIVSYGKDVMTPKEMLDEKGYEVFNLSSPVGLREKDIVNRIADVDAYLAGTDEITARVIEAGSRLKVISRFGIGVDSVDIKAATKRKVVVTNTPGVMAPAVADLTLALILGTACRLPFADKGTKEGHWPVFWRRDITGKTLGIIGLGHIGKEVAKRSKGFGMKVMVYDKRQDTAFAMEHQIMFVSLENLLRESDYISLHLTLNEETRHLIGKEQLKLMKRTAILINTSRGGVIDEQSLYWALKNNIIWGAGIDVYEKEPLRESLLFELENVVTTPHMGSSTIETMNSMGRIAVQNIIDVLEGRMPQYVVNPEVYGTG